MSYPLLLAEMKKKDLTISDVANVIQKSPKATLNKLYGQSGFKLSEAKQIVRALFPEDDFYSLFLWLDTNHL